MNTEVKKVSLGSVLGWVLGVLFAISGVTQLFSDPLTGILMLLLSAVLLPPANKFVADKFKFTISRGLKFILIIVLLSIIGARVSSTSSSSNSTPNLNSNQADVDKSTTPTTTEDTAVPTATSAPTQVKQIDNPVPTVKTEEKTTTPEPAQPKETPPTPTETVSQKNAVKSAKSYLNFSAFSRDGLITQLEFEKYTHADAVYGTDNSGANWNEQAAKSAKQYMTYSSFSRGGLIEQLKFEKFTPEQAEYGANAVGL